MKSSPPQQDAVVETWTANFLVLGQALYHWATLHILFFTQQYKSYSLLTNNFLIISADFAQHSFWYISSGRLEMCRTLESIALNVLQTSLRELKLADRAMLTSLHVLNQMLRYICSYMLIRYDSSTRVTDSKGDIRECWYVITCNLNYLLIARPLLVLKVVRCLLT